jgi:mannosyltransferase
MMLDSVDAVHGLYYGMMHVWFDTVPYSPLALRAPSVIAVGVTAGLVFALGRRVHGHRNLLVGGQLISLLAVT